MSLFGAFWDKDPNPVGAEQFGNNKGLFFNLDWYPKGVLHIGAWDAWEAKQYAHYCGSNSIFLEANPNSYLRFKNEIEQFGQKIDMPLFLAPTAMHRLYHHDGEKATSRAAEKFGTFFWNVDNCNN